MDGGEGGGEESVLLPPSLPPLVPGELGLGQEKSPFEEKLLGPNSRTDPTGKLVGWLGLCQQFE